MHYDEFKLIVEAVAYKPGMSVTCTLFDTSTNLGELQVRGSVPDSRQDLTRSTHCREDISVYSMRFVDLVAVHTEAQALSVVRQAVLGWEEHELDEWFRYRGALVNDPQRPGLAWPDVLRP